MGQLVKFIVLGWIARRIVPIFVIVALVVILLVVL